MIQVNDLPDAPWIRDAEQNGLPDYPEPKCPICGSVCEQIYADKDGEPVGCDECISAWDAWEWIEQRQIQEGGDE